MGDGPFEMGMWPDFFSGCTPRDGANAYAARSWSCCSAKRKHEGIGGITKSNLSGVVPFVGGDDDAGLEAIDADQDRDGEGDGEEEGDVGVPDVEEPHIEMYVGARVKYNVVLRPSLYAPSPY